MNLCYRSFWCHLYEIRGAICAPYMQSKVTSQVMRVGCRAVQIEHRQVLVPVWSPIIILKSLQLIWKPWSSTFYLYVDILYKHINGLFCVKMNTTQTHVHGHVIQSVMGHVCLLYVEKVRTTTSDAGCFSLHTERSIIRIQVACYP